MSFAGPICSDDVKNNSVSTSVLGPCPSTEVAGVASALEDSVCRVINTKLGETSPLVARSRRIGVVVGDSLMGVLPPAFGSGF